MSKPQGSMDENAEKTHSNSSRIETKRAHQWFTGGNEPEIYLYKKQAVEIPQPNSYTALLNSNVYCENLSNFDIVTGELGERFFEHEIPRTSNLFGIDSTMAGFSYGGIRKVKVSQVKDVEELLSDTSNRGEHGFVSVGEPPYTGSMNNNITTISQSFTKEDENNLSIPLDLVFGKGADDLRLSSGLSVRQSFGEDNIISFGGLNGDTDNNSSSARLVCNYDFLMGQSSVQRSEEQGLSESTSDAITSGVQVKKKEQKATKKIPPNNFPSNVRSLLSTGMLDGVPVKYVAWSREKELRGVIKGATYLCGCKSCTFSKAINAYEFERHAGCKTKHPNNHIYFENGKTIYGVVQELRNTPQNLLFEVIQMITGSQINQKSFLIWKESFLAATRELQRIYGKE